MQQCGSDQRWDEPLRSSRRRWRGCSCCSAAGRVGVQLPASIIIKPRVPWMVGMAVRIVGARCAAAAASPPLTEACSSRTEPWRQRVRGNVAATRGGCSDCRLPGSTAKGSNARPNTKRRERHLHSRCVLYTHRSRPTTQGSRLYLITTDRPFDQLQSRATDIGLVGMWVGFSRTL